ncbi:MAG TPA: DUF1549 domain-containing protein [Planctomycetota bacterium]|nr:DUF1549 domain-containing protein [Planctomycetota bacterium]
MLAAAAALLCALQAEAPDYAFARRATLDLAGRLPATDELRAFAKKPDRERLVAALLESDDARLYHADLWMQWLLDWDFDNPDFFRFKAGETHAWLREGFDRPFAATVKALLARDGAAGNFARKHLPQDGEPPVKLAVLSARLFLGRDIRCAQCHDHPSEKLSHEEFWAWTAFFGAGRGGLRDHLGERRAAPRMLDGRTPPGDARPLEYLAEHLDPRPALAERYWRLLTGRAGHPPELEAVETPKAMLRAIVDRPEYRAGPLKAMNPVQFMNAFATVFDLREAHQHMHEKAMASDKVLPIYKDEQVLRLFFHKWARDMLLPRGRHPEDDDARGTVRMALKLMNNGKVSKYYTSGWGLLRKVLNRTSRPADRVEELFLCVLGRPPSADERAAFRPSTDPDYEDLFWALVNSAEFTFVP